MNDDAPIVHFSKLRAVLFFSFQMLVSEIISRVSVAAN
uniref:Uncharacterized protein n=1 Tax=Arundo donax TaxID=35708 RepID=A0A0A8ZGA2_ARUDO